MRGCSYFYGAKAASDFLDANELLTIIRAHEAQLDGYKMHKWNDSDFPLVITIFSAPNYCDAYNNKGAVIKFDVPAFNAEQHAEHSAVQLLSTSLSPTQLYGRIHMVYSVRRGER